MILIYQSLIENKIKLVLICFLFCFQYCYANDTENINKFNFDFIKNNESKTYLLDIKQGSELVDKIKSVRQQSFETAYGDSISFNKWYKNKHNWSDLQFLFLTEIEKNTGFIWGFSTGEYGEKYVIQPSLTLGFIKKIQINKNTVFSLSASTKIGGNLKEKSCQADYGDIYGVMEVNCRLAATTLSPEETLQYNYNEKPYDKYKITIKIQSRF